MEAGTAVFGREDLGILAIGDPDVVPAGRYAREALRSLGAWDGLEDEVVRGATVCTAGETLWPPPPPKISAAAPAKAEPAPAPVVEEKKPSFAGPIMMAAIGGLALLGLGAVAPPSFMAHFTVFVLACFIGWQVVWNVTPALHTPLMSVTNAISGIIIVGGILQATSGEMDTAAILGAAAILVATINIAGGFLVTQRMLAMFRR